MVCYASCRVMAALSDVTCVSPVLPVFHLSYLLANTEFNSLCFRIGPVSSPMLWQQAAIRNAHQRQHGKGTSEYAFLSKF